MMFVRMNSRQFSIKSDLWNKCEVNLLLLWQHSLSSALLQYLRWLHRLEEEVFTLEENGVVEPDSEGSTSIRIKRQGILHTMISHFSPPPPHRFQFL